MILTELSASDSLTSTPLSGPVTSYMQTEYKRLDAGVTSSSTVY